jgi:hypothetical protein
MGSLKIGKTIKLVIEADDKSALEAAARLEKVYIDSASRIGKAFKDLEGKFSASTHSPRSTSDTSMLAAQREISQFQKQNILAEREFTRQFEREAKLRSSAQIREAKAGASGLIQELEKVRKVSAKSEFSSSRSSGDFFSTIFGNSKIGGIVGATSIGLATAQSILAVKDGVQALASTTYELGKSALIAGANYERTFNGLSAVVGNSQLAAKELKAIDGVARSTTGLRLETAEIGYQRLRALNFESGLATRLIKDLGQESLRSGVGQENVDRVLFNFTQIASGGQKIGQETREILTQIPTLKNAFIDAFGSLNGQKIQSQLDEIGTDEFFNRLLTSIEKNKTAVGGLDDSYGKLTDEFIVAGRELSKPVIPLLTKDVQNLTEYIRQNEKTWSNWGENIKLVYSDVRDFGKNTFKTSAFDIRPNESDQERALRLGPQLSKFDKPQSLLGQYFESLEKRRNKIDSPSNLAKAENELRSYNDSLQEQFLKAQDLALKAEVEAEKQREKELSGLKGFYDEKISIGDNYYKVASARLNARVKNTPENEISFLRDSGKLQSQSLNQQISLQTAFFNRQITLNEGNKEEISKITLEKNQKLRSLNSDLLINEINTLKQIAETERRIFDTRRQDTIAFKQLQSRELSQTFNSQSFDLNRTIGLGVNTSSSFAQLRDLTQKNFVETANIIREQSALQLQNLSLTAQQKANIIKQSNLELQDLAEQNRQKIIGIEDNQFQEQLKNLERFSERRQTQIQAGLDVTQNLFSSFSIENYQKGGISDTLFSQFFNFRDADKELESLQYLSARAGNYLAELQGSVEKAKNVAERNSIRGLIGNQQKLVDQYDQNINSIANATGLSKQLLDLQRLGNQLDSATVSIGDFDNAQKALLETVQGYKTYQLETSLKSLKDRKKLFDDAYEGKGDKINSAIIQGEIEKTQNSIDSLSFTNAQERIAQYRTLISGLTADIIKLRSGDVTTVRAIQNVTEKQLLNEQKDTLIQIEAIKYRIAKAPVIDNAKVELSYYEKILEIRQREESAVKSINSTLLEISANREYSANQTNALVLDGLNSRFKSVNQSIADFRLGIADGFLSPIDALFGRINQKLDKLPVGIREISTSFTHLFQDIIKQMANKFIMRLFGFESGNPVSANRSSGSFFSSAIGNFLGGNRATGTPSFNPSNSFTQSAFSPNSNGTFNGAGFSQALSQSLGGSGTFTLPNGQQMLSPFGGFSSGMPSIIPFGRRQQINLGAIFQNPAQRLFSGIGGFFGKGGAGAGLSGLAPLFGGQLGERIGGGLGSIAGGALGLSAFAALNPALLATALPFGASSAAVIGLLANPFTFAAAGTALAAAYFIKRNKQRRKDETTRDGSMVSTLKGLNEILAGLNRIPPQGVDSAIPSSEEFSTNYFSMAKALKSKKTREIALKDGRERVTPLVERIASLVPIAKANELSINDRRNRLVAEFADGSYMSSSFLSQYTGFKRRNGMLHGTFTGRDTLPSMLAEGEMVLNPHQINRVKQVSGFDPFKYARIPNYAEGVSLGSSASLVSPQNIQNTTNPVIKNEMTLVLENVVALPDAKGYLESADGSRQIVQILKKAKNNKDLGFLNK